MSSISDSEQYRPTVEASAELNNIMGRTVFVDVFKKVLDQGGFTKRDDPIIPIQANPEIVKGVIDGSYQRLVSVGVDDGERYKVVLPESYDGEKEVRQTAQEIITLLHESGLIDITLLRATAKYAGPSNARYYRGEHSTRFKPTDLYFESLERMKLDHKYGEALPIVPGNRNELFTIEIGEDGLLAMAGRMKQAAEKAGLSLTDTEAIKLGLLYGVGHEYGHAIMRGTQHMGIPTLERAKLGGFIRAYDKVAPNEIQIHDEYMAEGFSNIALEEYLKEKMGYTSDQITTFRDRLHCEEYYASEAVYAFFDYATLKEFTPREIASFSTALLFAAHQNFADDQNLYLWRLNDMIQYHTQPYTRKQITELIKH